MNIIVYSRLFTFMKTEILINKVVCTLYIDYHEIIDYDKVVCIFVHFFSNQYLIKNKIICVYTSRGNSVIWTTTFFLHIILLRLTCLFSPKIFLQILLWVCHLFFLEFWTTTYLYMLNYSEFCMSLNLEMCLSSHFYNSIKILNLST